MTLHRRYAFLYSSIGVVLGLGSPLGMLLIRFWLAGRVGHWSWLQQELLHHLLFYGYMAVGTVIAFALFGYFLGKGADLQQAANVTLRRQIEQLRLTAVKDSLTGAFSRAYMMEHLRLEIEVAKRSGTAVSVAMVDVDDFKEINDRFGHLAGDRLLKSVSNILHKHVRSKDTICRYGGDEFLIIMSDTNLRDAEQLIERIRKTTADSNIRDIGELKDIRLTISAGLAAFEPPSSEGPMDVIHRADQNLYKAKREGKNRTCKA